MIFADIQWDVLALEHEIQELFHVHSGPDPEDIVSITKLVVSRTDFINLTEFAVHSFRNRSTNPKFLPFVCSWEM